MLFSLKVWEGKLSDVEEQIAESDTFVDDLVLLKTDDSLVYKSGYWVFIPALNFNVHEGTFCCREENGEYSPDFSIAIVCDADDDGPESYLYWEQDGMIVTLANYLHGRGCTIASISEMACELHMPDGA